MQGGARRARRPPRRRRPLVCGHEAPGRRRCARRSSTAGRGAVAASTDPMIVLARQIDPMAREVRKFLEDEVEAPITRATEKIAEARWKVYGRTVPPDATFTLRLSYGTVKGFPAEGTIGRALHDLLRPLRPLARPRRARPPGTCPPRWLEKKGALDLAVPLNFVSTERHHRRQLGQPGRGPRGRVRGHRLRRQHREPGLGLLLRRRAGPRGGGRRARRSSRRCARSTAPTRSSRSWRASSDHGDPRTWSKERFRIGYSRQSR